jgi:hypothetical protein
MTRSRATPPSGKMFSRTCVNRRGAWCGTGTVKVFFVSPASSCFGRIGCHTTAASVASAPRGSPQASIEQCDGKFPLKNAVSTTNAWITPGSPRRRMHQSWPGVRRRRVSQPSIHLPRSVYLSGMKTAASGLSRFSFSAKNSSLAASASPPSRADARSIRWVNSLITSLARGPASPPPRSLRARAAAARRFPPALACGRRRYAPSPYTRRPRAHVWCTRPRSRSPA